MRGIINIVIGLIMVVGGLSGGLVLRGTHSGGGLAVLGGVLLVLGIARLMKSSGSAGPQGPGAPPPPNDGPPVTRG